MSATEHVAAVESWSSRPVAGAKPVAGTWLLSPALDLLLGRAFCSRRLGRLKNAETDYLQLLQSSPSPGNHFLLALFYDDVQNAPAALKHALAAQKLDSRNFGAAGRQLIRNLQDSHFGCFSVYWQSR